MKSKIILALIVPVILFLLTVPVSAQENSDLTRANKEYQEAVEGVQTAKRNLNSANSLDEIKAANTVLAEALKDADYKKRILDLLEQQIGGRTNIQPPAGSSNPNPAVNLNPTPTPSPVSIPAPTPSPTVVPGDSTNPTGGGTNPTPSVSSSDNLVIVECNNRVGVYNKRLCTIALNAARQTPSQVKLGDSRSPLQMVIFAQLVARGNTPISEANKKFILDAEEARTDKQIGSNFNTRGTTSLVQKGGVPAVFNFATETGAMTRSISGTTMTFRFNPVGFFEAISNSNYNYIDSFMQAFKQTPVTDLKKLSLSRVIESTLSNGSQIEPTDTNAFKYESKRLNYFRKLGVGISFDVSRGQETPLFTGDDRQISAFSLKYEFLNERDPRHPKYAEAWRNFFVAQGGDLIENITQAEADSLFTLDNEGIKFKNERLRVWFADLNTEIRNIVVDANLSPQQALIRRRLAIEDKIQEFLSNRLPVVELQKDPDLFQALNTITTAFVNFNTKQQALLNEIAKAPVISFEYTNNRETTLPDTHNFNFILAKGFSMSGGKDAPVMDATFNASLTFFNKKPVGMNVNRIKDFSFAGQLDIPLGNVLLNNLNHPFYSTTFSFAGRFQRLTGNALALDGTLLPNTKGDIWVGQLKLEIPFNLLPGVRGIRFPISATFANRTELVRESHVRGNFGFTFDIDKLILAYFLNR